MKNVQILFRLFILIFLFSCSKKGPSTQPTTTTVQVESACTAPIAIDTASFSSTNKIPDATISPATGGSAAQNQTNNYQQIQYCLLRYGHAVLADNAEFDINKVLIMNNATLTSASSTWPILKMMDSTSNSVIKVFNHSRVSFLTINANKMLLGQPNASVVELDAFSAQVDNNWIEGATAPLLKTDNGNIVGVYLMCGDSNLVLNNKITSCSNGFISASTVAYTNNVVKENNIYYNRGDGVSLPGYAQIISNVIYLNGWDCRNGTPPIPGAGIYSQDNYIGALIQGNIIHDNNGHNIDVNNVQHFSILNDSVYNPGNMSFPATDYSTAPAYGAAFSISLLDISNSHIEGNIVRNEGRPTNSVNYGHFGNDPNGIMSAISAATFSDLPFGGNTIIAFSLAENRPAVVKNQTSQDTIRNNTFIASPNGIGYFASRNTGFANDLSWSFGTTNYYTLNNPTGSNVGSVRCGGNWYAANGVDKNTDDSQHAAPIGDSTGNDFKSFY